MKIRSLLGSFAITACALLTLNAAPVYAETTFIPNYILKAQGMDMRKTEIVGISPDNKYLCCMQPMMPIPGKKAYNTFFIVPISSKITNGSIRALPLEGISTVGNVAFTPDSQSILFTSLEGSKLVKVNCQTGEMTTIMEHQQGKPGFMIYPEVLEYSKGKILTLGYHYDSDDFAGPNAIAEIDPDKTGLDAFVHPCLIDHVQDAVIHNNKFQNVRQGYPMKDVGFLAGFDKEQTYCTIYAWDGARGSLKIIEDCKGMIDCVFSDSRIVYSVKDNDKTYKLCVYDAKTDEKIVVDSERKSPHCYTLMSSDGKTIVFSDESAGADVYKTYYARESEGWKVKPIEGLEKNYAFGRQRLSCDGTHMAFHNRNGLNVVEIKAPKDYKD